MRLSLKLQLSALACALLLLALAIAWTARTGWREVVELREGLEIAEQFDAAVVKLKGVLQSAKVKNDPQEWERLLGESREMDAWIDVQKGRLTSQRERELLDRIDVIYDRFRTDAAEFTQRLQRGELNSHEKERVAALVDQLFEVRRQGVSQFLADSHNYLATLQMAIGGLLALLAAVAAGLSVAVYRGLITPMRTRLIEAGAALEKSEKLASLGVLAAGVAHEIRNPLTAIKARLYTHRKMLAENSPALADTDFISEEIGRLERIVREFLQFARPAEPQRAPVSPAQLFREVRELLAPELEKSSVQLAVDGTVETALQADCQQIMQVLINLIQNAAESIGQNGRISLRARKGKVPIRGRLTEAVILEVEDTGKGIPPEVEKRLFDPFFTTKASGTGLGLSIAARIVEKHGGALQLRTRANHGTTFGIVLPATES